MTTALEARWTAKEESFLRCWIGRMPHKDMAAALGRSEMAVRVRLRQRRISVHRWLRQSNHLTVTRLAAALGVDDKTAYKLMDRVLPTTAVYLGNQEVSAVRRADLVRWLADPLNWYCLPDYGRQVTDRRLRRVVARARRCWDDEWLSTGDIVERYHYTQQAIAKWRSKGLPAYRWGNWHHLRSDVEFYYALEVLS